MQMINKQPLLVVPAGIRYLGEWAQFQLPEFPSIIDKKLTGCGFTEYVIRSPFNAILVSPRRVLLENKCSQHNPTILVGDEEYEIPEQRVIYYAQCDWEEDLAVDKNLEKDKESKVEEVSEEEKKTKYQIFKDNLLNAIRMFQLYGKPIKISVTYDSFRKVKEILQELGILDTFKVVVDEFQSIFTDASFKPGTELEFVNALQGVQNVSYVSATPMIEDYLSEIDEFKNLPYFELDWVTEEPGRVKVPTLFVNETKRINGVFKSYIDEYRKGIFAKKVITLSDGSKKVVEARELVFYVNSVKNICDAIKQNNLEPWEVDILCADTKENRTKIREAFRVSLRNKYGDGYLKYLPSLKKVISKVSTPDPKTGISKNKPFMFCTKTVYLGADFYSTCARTIVVSDSGIECLMVDITLDLPQILGRQRLEINPWKYEAEVWVKFGMKSGKISPEEFQAVLDSKIGDTKSLLRSYDRSLDEDKHVLAEGWERQQKVENYKYNYVGVNHHAGSDIKPQFNNLVKIAEKRAFDIQQIDYSNRFSVLNRIGEVMGEGSIEKSKELSEFTNSIENTKYFHEKMKYICGFLKNISEIDFYIQYTPEPFKMYIQTLGIDYILSVGGQKSKLDSALNSRQTSRVFTSEDLKEVVVKYFENEPNKRWSKSDLKSILGEIYKQLGISKKAKASDLEEWFELKRISIIGNSGKRIDGFEIIKRK